MPPARPRPALDDSRSEASSVLTSTKDRANTGAGVSKTKKSSLLSSNDNSAALRVSAVNGSLNALAATANSAAELETPQTDWTSIPVPLLHTYRAAYKISTPASYSGPHAELIYNSSDVAKRSPSQVLARRKLRDLKSHRRKMAQTNGHNSNKSSKNKLKVKDNEANSDLSRDGRRKQNGVHSNMTNGDNIAQSIEPMSPTMASATASDSASSSLLNSSNPEATIIGRQSPTALATTVRKHFNAQPLHEHDTIARFAYVMRQQGYGNAALPMTTGNAASSSASSALPRTATPIRVEGSEGDGSGWVMGSMGRQVRISDSGGGSFRLRFRPQV